MLRSPFKSWLLAATGFMVLFSTAGIAANTQVRSKFTLEFLGVGVGTMKSAVQITGNNYKISGSAKTGKMISIVSKSKAGFSSKGRIRGTRLIPTRHSLDYKSNKKRGAVDISFSGGNVVKSTVTPKKKIKKGTVPIRPAHLKSVLDPISSLLFPVLPGDIGNGQKICNRTLPVYGGQARMNLVLSYLSSAKTSVSGFSGDTFTCAVRYQPVSGHRPSKKDVKFMQSNRDMQITMARIGTTNIYGLFAFKVKTDKGTVSGYATKFASR